jgi:hypothetical protein
LISRNFQYYLKRHGVETKLVLVKGNSDFPYKHYAVQVVGADDSSLLGRIAKKRST